MELYNNNSSNLQDISTQKQVRVIKKNKGTATEPAKPDADHISGSVHIQDSSDSDNVGDEVQSGNTEETPGPENSQSKQPENTNSGMNFANRYK